MAVSVPKMNGLHLLLVAGLLHCALVWRAERRGRDLVLGALLAGLCVSNHGLAIPRPYVWVKTADQILASLARYCGRISNSAH